MTRLTKLLFAICIAAALAFLLYPVSFREKLFALAYGIDPQRPSHTYFLGAVQLPLEARKMGMFGGFAITCLALAAAGKARAALFPSRRFGILLAGFIALMAADGLNATFYDLGWPHVYAPDLRLRLATGMLTGIAMAGLLVPAVNGSLWRELRLDRSLSGGRELAGVLAVAASLYVLVDARLAILYYPLAVVGVAGLLLELTFINMIFALALMKRVGMAERLQDVLASAAGAFVLSMCELALMSAVRFLTLGDLTSLM